MKSETNSPEVPSNAELEAAKVLVPKEAGEILAENNPGALLGLAKLAEDDPEYVAHIAAMMEKNPDPEDVIDSAVKAPGTHEIIGRFPTRD